MCEAVERYGDQREARGMQQGMQKNTQQVIQKAVKMKLPLEDIAQLVSLPSNEVKKIIDQLEQN